MKKTVLFFAILMTGLFSQSILSQTDNEPVALGLPGDNLNLYAVLDIFQKSKTLEDFEKVLNEQDSKVNNLDLNNDGKSIISKSIVKRTEIHMQLFFRLQ